MRLHHQITGPLVVAVLLGLDVRGAFAQSQKVERTVRVEQPDALVRARANLKAEVVAPAPVDTVLVLLDREADWLWVLLPPDAHGTSRPGWIRAKDVEKSVTPDPADAPVAQGPVKRRHKPPRQARAVQEKPVKQIAELNLVKPVAALRLEKPVVEDTRRLDKAKRDLERAKQGYERLTPTIASAPLPE